MMDYTMELAGQVIKVESLYESTCQFCREYLSEAPAAISVTMQEADIAYERQKSLREHKLEGKPGPSFRDAELEITALQRKIAEELFVYDTLVFHGSVVAVDGQCYLFTAKSGTGKSTHTRLWREYFGHRAVMVNDDKPFLKITDTGVLAYGSPWNGKHGLGTNSCFPLKAICILERGEDNRISAISPKEALAMLLQQSNRPMNPHLMPKYLELIDKLCNGVSFYTLACNMDAEAAVVAYEAMSGKRKEE